MNTKAMLSLAILLGLPGAVWAQTVTAPDESGHLRKMTEELVRLSRTKDADAKVDLFLKLGEERTKELEKLQVEGKSTYSDALGTSYQKHVTQGAGRAIENGAAQGKDMSAACGRYAAATSKHLAVLERVLASAPAAARQGLLTAIAASQHGHEQAILAHQRGKGRSGAGPATSANATCGCDRDEFKGKLKKLGKSDDDADREAADHFKKHHPEGRCHCACRHGEGDLADGRKPKDRDDDDRGGKKKDCGHDRDDYKKGLKRKGKSDDDCERDTADHFKRQHSDGGLCHCSCDHPKGNSKGNNGVGNGIDPQPPGNPPVNDGAGTGPGNPGNKHHGPGGPPAGKGDDGPGKGKGPPPGKGKPGEDEGPGKGKGPHGPPGGGKGKEGDDDGGKGKGKGGS